MKMLENMLDYVRYALYTVLIVIGFFLFQAWEKDHQKTEASAAVSPVAANTSVSHLPAAVPAGVTVKTQAKTEPALPPFAAGKLVKVQTDLLDVTIDTLGGDVVAVHLLQYPESLHSSQPFILLNDNAKTRYIAESGLLSKVGPDTTSGQALYTTSQDNYALQANEKDLVVTLNWQKDGIHVIKTFHFVRGSYEVKVGYKIENKSNTEWQGNLYTQLMRTDVQPENSSGLMNLTTYFGAAIATPQKPFEKISFKTIEEKGLNQEVQGGWAAMIQHYFITAWVPPRDAVSNYYTKKTSDGLYTIGMIGQPIVAAPGSNVAVEAKLYTGPAIADLLEKTAPGLKLTIDYGWFWFISDIIFWMMQKIYDVVGNWGWSIVLVTVVIKLLFYHLSAKSYRSMSTLKKLQPRIEALKQRFGDDKQKLTQATLELYREQKVNPMSGCLPILIQIPVFIALYWVLVESVQLRQAPFIFWIHDLSRHDPYYVLPLLMGISMFLQQRLNPPPPDPTQAKVMMLMPIIFTFLFANFPAGLMLYWFVNNTLSFLQQWHIMHKLEKENGKGK
jgi:YidC/Oxa1 family membrane protein insertase